MPTTDLAPDLRLVKPPIKGTNGGANGPISLADLRSEVKDYFQQLNWSNAELLAWNAKKMGGKASKDWAYGEWFEARRLLSEELDLALADQEAGRQP